MPEMFGMPAGIEAAQEGIDRHALQQLAIQKGQQDLDAQRRMAKLLAEETAEGSPDDPAMPLASNQVLKLARLAAQSGAVNQAVDMFGKVSSMRHAESQTAQEKWKVRMQEVEEAERLVAGATDADSWNRGIAAYKLMTGKDSPLAGIPYSPENKKMVEETLKTSKNVAAAQLAQARIPLVEAQTKQARAHTAYEEERTVTEKEVRRDLVKAQTKAADARAAHVGKVGGSARAPTQAQLKSATDMIVRDYLDITPEESRIVGREVAERATDIMASHPGLRATEAMAQAYAEKQQEGAFDDYLKAPMRKKKGGETPALPEGFVLD